MSFSLPFGFDPTAKNKKRRWAHDDPSFGTRPHIETFLRTLGLSNVKNPEYIRALDEIRPFIEQHLITLGVHELPDGAAFRIPEYDYLGISMNKENLKGKSQTIEYIGNVLEIDPCQQDQLSCSLPYLYPYWYASSKHASFVYAEGRSTHYKRLSIEDMKHFHFLKLSTSMIDLKQQLNWDALMTTPQEVIGQLNAIEDYDSLHEFMTTVMNPDADRPIPIDSKFMSIFIEKCKKLVLTGEQFNATRKLIIDSAGVLTDPILISSNWHKIILKILQRNGMATLTEEMRGLITCVAYFEILTPLGMRFWSLHYVKVVMQGIQLETLLEQNPQYGDGKPLLEVLEKYCKNATLTEMETTEIMRINPNVRLKSIRDCKQSYDTLFEHMVNKSNCGIMNYNLTTRILGFMRAWFLNGAISNINTLFGVVESRQHNFEQVYDQMLQNYGDMHRHSTPAADLIFATCVNLLLFHLFPQNTPVGYYLGQCIIASKYGTGLKYSSMNAELTLARSANIRNIGIVRKLTFTESGHETSPETDDDAADADADDYLGGGRKGKNRRQTIRKSRRRRRSTSRKCSKKKYVKNKKQ
jgi:hypothetical protein